MTGRRRKNREKTEGRGEEGNDGEETEGWGLEMIGFLVVSMTHHIKEILRV